MNQELLNKVHKIEIELLDRFVFICEENNLSYFLTAGTLIGAVRHGGFIPWDDDVDVAMPRKDYEKFLDLFDKKDENNYYVLSERSPPDTKYHYFPFAKLCKKGTLFADNAVEPKDHCGIWIDIWPFDNAVPFFLPLQTYLISLLLIAYHVKMTEHVPRKKLTKFLVKIPNIIFSSNTLKKAINKLFFLFDNQNTQYISFFSGRYGYRRETHKYNSVFPLKKIIFEGKYYCVPGNHDIFLKRLYGDYMELPPPEKRRVHTPDLILFENAHPELEKQVSIK